LRDYYSRAQNLTAAANGLEAIFKPNRNLRDPLTFPLHAAAIICYARPFTHNEEVGALPARYARFATQRARDAHEDALHVRDKIRRAQRLRCPEAFDRSNGLGNRARLQITGRRLAGNDRTLTATSPCSAPPELR
jgi:hypothetical protein